MVTSFQIMLALHCFLVPLLLITGSTNSTPVDTTDTTDAANTDDTDVESTDFCADLTCEVCPKEGCNQLCAELNCEER